MYNRNFSSFVAETFRLSGLRNMSKSQFARTLRAVRNMYPTLDTYRIVNDMQCFMKFFNRDFRISFKGYAFGANALAYIFDYRQMQDLITKMNDHEWGRPFYINGIKFEIR